MSSSNSIPLRNAIAAGAWLLLAGYAAVRAWLHWRAIFPFGSGGFCGHGSVAHCAWCGLAAISAAMAWMSWAAAKRSSAQPQAVRIDRR